MPQKRLQNTMVALRAIRLLRRGECSALGNCIGISLSWGISDGVQGHQIVRYGSTGWSKGSDRIVQCSCVLGVRKGERERLGAGLHWPRERGRRGEPRMVLWAEQNNFIKLYIVFDYRTHMSGRCLLLVFFLLCCACKPLVASLPSLCPVLLWHAHSCQTNKEKSSIVKWNKFPIWISTCYSGFRAWGDTGCQGRRRRDIVV